MFRLRRTVLCAALLAITPILVPHALPASAAQSHHYSAGIVGPKQVYLALGDSLAFGFQPNLDFKHGYASDWFNELQPKGVTKLVNYACPGETLVTFMNGGCALHFLVKSHYPHSEPQYKAALTYIKQNKGKVSPVSIDIGANDFVTLFDPSTCAVLTNTQGISDAIQTFDTNFTTVLTQLKSALGGTGDLFAMNYYNPFAEICPQQTALIQLLDQHLQQDATSVGVPWADVYTPFNVGTGNGDNICNWTWMCQSKPKNVNLRIHPNNTGYTQIYQAFTKLAGY